MCTQDFYYLILWSMGIYPTILILLKLKLIPIRILILIRITEYRIPNICPTALGTFGETLPSFRTDTLIMRSTRFREAWKA